MPSALLSFALTIVLASGLTSPQCPMESATSACTIGGIGVPDGSPPLRDVPLVMSCFTSVAEAEEFIARGAPGDAERLVAASTTASSPTPVISRTTATSTVIVGRAWSGTSRTGNVLVHWGVGTGCHGVSYGFASFSSAWNDVIRSAEGFSGCRVTHYSDISYLGNSISCYTYCAVLGQLDQKSSSAVYRPS